MGLEFLADDEHEGRRLAAEFFAGIGLMRMGLDQCGWKTVYANDIDPKKEKMYTDQFGSDPNFVLGDIHEIQPSEIPRVNLATASFPCNDLSLAGARGGLAGTHSSAFWGFVDILRGMGNNRPEVVMLENVAGFLTSNGGADLKDALQALNTLGYRVDAFIIDAARFVPQSRVRLFIVGELGDQVLRIAEPAMSFFESDVRPKALADFIFRHPEIAWNVRNLPRIPQGEKRLPDIIEKVPGSSKLWWSRERCEYLLNQMSPKHRAVADTMISGKTISYATVFRRVRSGVSMAELRTDGFAGCLRTPRGGSGRQILFVAGKGNYSVRLLSARECARLMGADDFNLVVPLNQALFGFGDAVCVPVIQWIGENYLNPLMEEREGGPMAGVQRKIKYGK